MATQPTILKQALKNTLWLLVPTVIISAVIFLPGLYHYYTTPPPENPAAYGPVSNPWRALSDIYYFFLLPIIPYFIASYVFLRLLNKGTDRASAVITGSFIGAISWEVAFKISPLFIGLGDVGMGGIMIFIVAILAFLLFLARSLVINPITENNINIQIDPLTVIVKRPVRSYIGIALSIIIIGLLIFSFTFLYIRGSSQSKTAAEHYKNSGLADVICTSQEGALPIINSLSGDFAPIGEILEIGGCNLAGFEGDTNVWIENDRGEKGILYGNRPYSTNEKISFTLTSPVCQTDNSYSGLPCEQQIRLVPGQYKIYVMPWGKKSNEILFTIPTPEEYARSRGMINN